MDIQLTGQQLFINKNGCLGRDTARGEDSEDVPPRSQPRFPADVSTLFPVLYIIYSKCAFSGRSVAPIGGSLVSQEQEKGPKKVYLLTTQPRLGLVHRPMPYSFAS